MAEVQLKRSHLGLPNGKRIGFREAGPESGEPVVLVAGWPQTLHAWRHVQAKLAEAGIRSIALDPPGLGESDPLDAVADYATPNVARIMAEALAIAGIERHVLVGHDVGAWISFAWAATQGQRVVKLVLLDAAVPGALPDGWLTLERAPGIFQFFFNAVPILPERLTQGRERVYLEWLFETKTRVKNAIMPADIDVYMRNYGIPERMSAGFDYYRAVPASVAALAGKSRLTMPVLALGAEGGVGTAIADALRPHCSDLEGGVIMGSGHFIPEEAPDELTAQLVTFIGSRSR